MILEVVIDKTHNHEGSERYRSLLLVKLPNGKTVSCEELYEDYSMDMYECKFPANPY